MFSWCSAAKNACRRIIFCLACSLFFSSLLWLSGNQGLKSPPLPPLGFFRQPPPPPQPPSSFYVTNNPGRKALRWPHSLFFFSFPRPGQYMLDDMELVNKPKQEKKNKKKLVSPCFIAVTLSHKLITRSQVEFDPCLELARIARILIWVLNPQ